MANDEWITQSYVYKWIQRRLPFKMILDLAASWENQKCGSFISKVDDALEQDWSKEFERAARNQEHWQLILKEIADFGCWCNPPYSRPNLPRFLANACYEAKRGLNQCFLVPLDITGWSRDYVWSQAEVWIPDERIVFIDPATGEPQTQPPKGSMIVIYGPLANKGLVKPVHIPKPEEKAEVT